MNSSELNLTISQDKIVDLLMHAATREDIAKLDAKFDTKIDSEVGKIDAKFTKIDAKFAKIDEKIDKLDAKIERLDGKIDEKIDKLDEKYNKIIWLIIAAILTPILIHFLTK